MTAIESLTSKVSVTGSTLPDVSSYRDVVGKSIWNPHASEGLSLIGRAIVLTAALLVGYFLIKALFFILFRNNTPSSPDGPSEIDEICDRKNCSAPHTHFQSTDTFSQEEILKLCNIQNLKEEECLYTEDLTVEQNQIQLLMQDEKTKPLLEYIKNETSSKEFARGVLFVLLGIKPALAIEQELDEKMFSILKNLTRDYEHLKWKESEGPRTGTKAVYFANETPLSSFDPRQFLNLCPEVSLTDAVALCFAKQHLRDADQFLSYLLGFGPSWESHAINADYLGREEKVAHSKQGSVSCVFKNKHYREIGKALNPMLSEEKEIEKLGFNYHCQFASLIPRSHWLREKPNLMQDVAVDETLDKTGTKQMFDGLTARTEYFKKSYTLKKWVMETYFSSLI